MYKKIKMTDKCHPEFGATHVTAFDNVDKRLRNKCAIVCNLFPRPFGERVRERGYLAASLLDRLAAFTLAEGATHVATCNNSRKIAFTLAEVLITLGIIGVVAAMTMPTLINNINKKHWITGYKKAFSELSQIHQLLNSETGGSYMAECNDFDDVCLKNLFAEKMKVVEYCKETVPNKCQESSTYLNGRTRGINQTTEVNDPWPTIVTASGYSVKFRFHGNDCSEFIEGYSQKLPTCGWMQIDVNGLKRPNVVGKDIYFLNIFKNKLFPRYSNELNGQFVSELYETLKEDCENGEGVGCSTIYLYK